MRLRGWRGLVVGAMLPAACASSAGAQPIGSNPPATQLPGPPSVQRPEGDSGSSAATEPAAAAAGPADVARQIATGCTEKRFSEVGDLLHPTLRRTWIDIDYKVKDFCELITRGYTLRSVRIDSEERVGAHAVVFLTYVYVDGSELTDRSTFLPHKGAWKLTG